MIYKVLNQKYDEYTDNTVYIGRPSKWGNPYIIGKLSRKEVIEKYREYILNSPLMNDIHELKNKNLMCWCAPMACHGDVLMELVNKEYPDREEGNT